MLDYRICRAPTCADVIAESARCVGCGRVSVQLFVSLWVG